MKRVGKFDVVNVMAQTLDQSRVLGALYSLSNIFGHGLFSN
jgi:hypothetical protein